MLPTPSTSHVSFDTIYEPAEDSFLLLDTLSSQTESAWLSERFKLTSLNASHNAAPLIIEVGSGSGVVLAFLAANADFIFGRPDILTLSTDVNPSACKATQITVQRALEDPSASTSAAKRKASCGAAYIASITSDLYSCLVPNSVDVLVFNPPYVPTSDLPGLPNENSSDAFDKPSYEMTSHLLSLSYAGGADGMETTNRLLAQLPSVLTLDRGVAYVLLCAQNNPGEVKNRIKNWGSGWTAETVGYSGKAAGWEKLQILRIWKRDMSHQE